MSIASPNIFSKDDIAIVARNLSKTYKVYRQNSDLLVETFTGRVKHSTHHSLQDVSFEMAKGQCFGVIGANGAGKSTLLKIVAGTLSPTSGDICVKGKVSAILELGTGFHPEYSGRDNVLLGGMCLGMTRQEVEEKYDWIVSFAELGDAIDKPFKTYSSGMQARLTFATAISIDPEILIIDEALAAGDSYFVVKCGRRVRQLCESGATVLFVSHSTHQVATLCSKAIWLEDGRVREIGDAIDVCRRYDYAIHERLSSGAGKVVEETETLVGSTSDDVEAGSVPLSPVAGDIPEGRARQAGHKAARKELVDLADTVDEAAPSQGVTVFDAPHREEETEGDRREARPVPRRMFGDVLIEGLEVLHGDVYRRGPARITSIRLVDERDLASAGIRTGDRMSLKVEYVCDGAAEFEGTLGLSVAFNRKHDLLSAAMFSTVNPMRDEEMRFYDQAPYRLPPFRKGRLEAVFPSFELLSGEYLLSLGLAPNIAGTAEFNEYHHMRFLFRVLRTGYPSGSVFHPTVEWHHLER